MIIQSPHRILTPYIEAYYLSSHPGQEWPKVVYPAISTCYIKLSTTAAVISGQATKPTDIDLGSCGITGLGVKMRVGGFFRLFAIPAHELTNRVVNLDEILGPAADEILEHMAEEEDPNAWIRCFERRIIRLAQRRSKHNYPIETQAVNILRHSPAWSVSRLADKFGYSARQFQRKLSDFTGMSPRQYKRVCRFEHAFDLIQRSVSQSRIDWPAFALASGYSDQAHLIRDFRRFAGYTPKFFLTSLK